MYVCCAPTGEKSTFFFFFVKAWIEITMIWQVVSSPINVPNSDLMLAFQMCLGDICISHSLSYLHGKQNRCHVRCAWRRKEDKVVAAESGRRARGSFFKLIKQLKSFFVTAGEMIKKGREAKRPKGKPFRFIALQLFWPWFLGCWPVERQDRRLLDLFRPSGSTQRCR